MALKPVWKEFPEINRRVAFTYNCESTIAHSLGCHCGTIQGVTASFGDSYYAANNGRNIEVIDTSKEPQLTYLTVDHYSGRVETPEEETRKVLTYILDKKITFEDIAENAYKEIIDKCRTIPLWVMSDVINYEAPARQEKPLDLSPRQKYGPCLYKVIGHTSDFANYLITKKIGYVMASPIVQNPSHRTKRNYSLNRGWFWIHPDHVSRAIHVAEEFGEDKFPDSDSWIKTVAEDLELSEESVLKNVLEEGRFPEDARFKPNALRQRYKAKPAEPLTAKPYQSYQPHRGKNGQFLPKPYINAA